MKISKRAMDGLLLADLPMCEGLAESVRRSRIQSLVDNTFSDTVTRAEYRAAATRISKMQVDLVEAKKVIMKCYDREKTDGKD